MQMKLIVAFTEIREMIGACHWESAKKTIQIENQTSNFYGGWFVAQEPLYKQ